jgi:hypothetical protein
VRTKAEQQKKLPPKIAQSEGGERSKKNCRKKSRKNTAGRAAHCHSTLGLLSLNIIIITRLGNVKRYPFLHAERAAGDLER